MHDSPHAGNWSEGEPKPLLYDRVPQDRVIEPTYVENNPMRHFDWMREDSAHINLRSPTSSEVLPETAASQEACPFFQMRKPLSERPSATTVFNYVVF